MNGAELLLRCLEAEGVERIWGYPGGAIMPVYDALLDSPIRHFLTRHEQGAAFAAQGYARSTGEVGVCMATSGPGATNLVTGIADAYLDSVPLVAITGQVPRALIGTDAFQEVDVLGITLPIVKHSYLVSEVESIPGVVREAFATARGGRPGPVVIDLPKDVAQARVAGRPEPVVDMAPASLPSADALAAAAELLRTSQRPLIYAGGGVEKGSAVDALRRFVEATGIPVVHTLHGLGAVPSEHPRFLGMLGMHGTRAANHAVQECDLLVAVGVRFDDRATGKLSEFAPEAKVIHLDIDAAELGKLRVPHAAVRGDLSSALETLACELEIEPWQARCEQWQARWPWRYDAPFDSVYAPALLHQLSKSAPAGSFVVCDVGQHQMWVAQHWSFEHPRQHLTSGGLGTMGFGLPAAIGVQIAHPEATVINVTGDGSFMMNLQELATVRRYDLPIKIVVIDNSALGMVRQWQECFFGNRESEVDLSDNPDFADVGRAFGIQSLEIEYAEQVSAALELLLDSRGPMLLHVRIDRQANVWPLVPAGANNSQMITDGIELRRSACPQA
ncbi:MAG: acetolactate synthase 2 catalytic subunit [Acidobacteriota bacterium]